MARTTHTPAYESDLLCRNFLLGCVGLSDVVYFTTLSVFLGKVMIEL